MFQSSDNQITGVQFNKDEWHNSYSMNVNSLKVKLCMYRISTLIVHVKRNR